MKDAWFNFKLMYYRGADFSGVSSRAEFWHPVLIGFLLGLALVIPLFLALLISDSLFRLLVLLLLVFQLGTIHIWIALTIRRLRDAGYNPHCAWLYIVPLGGPIVWYMCAQPSTSLLSKSTPPLKTVTRTVEAPRTATQEKKQSGEAFECAACGAEVAADSNFCQSCGANFDSDTVECAYCDAEVPNNANFCPSCGAEFES